MSARCQFDPDARTEYHEAIRYYAMEAGDTEIAVRFVVAIESALAAICTAPELWRAVGPPDLRRYVLRHFPFVLYYRSTEDSVVIYAVMHTTAARLLV